MKKEEYREEFLTKELLDHLRQRKDTYFLERSPGNKQVTLHSLPGKDVQEYYGLGNLVGKKGIVLVPFDLELQDTPILLLPHQHLSSSSYSIPHTKVGDTHHRQALSYDSPELLYQEAFKRCMKALEDGPYSKLVLSRSKRVSLPSSFDLFDTYCRACHTYPTAYVYMFVSDSYGIWLGATPELLLETKNNKGRTMALAGTMPLEEELQQSWDKKNIGEHGYVDQFIKEQLRSLSIEPKEGAVETIKAGELLHLKKEYSFDLPPLCSTISIIEALHPTPAVCGVPKDSARELLTELEPHSRSYYSGCLGRLEMQNETHIYVNLRCMQIDKSSATLYAGGGLVIESDLRQEWNETVNKMMTMLKILEQ